MLTIGRIAAACAGMTVVAGCALGGAQSAGPEPANYKAAMAAMIEGTFFDPYSLREVAISEPFPHQALMNPGWVVCLSANAKNRLGGYAGVRTMAYLMRGDEVVDKLLSAAPCDDVAMAPWPEMENRQATN
jgi:hypothetical protein